MRLQIVGRGRMGSAVCDALVSPAAREVQSDDFEVLPLAGRGASGLDADGAAVDAVLLAVPDDAIPAAAAAIVPGPIVGHCSGATPLAALGARSGFSMHPLLTVLGAGAPFAGAFAAVDGTDEHALDIATRLATALGLETFRVHDEDRAVYHAAASVASNFLVTLEGLAERLAQRAGVPRAALLPLAEAALRNWGERGAEAALTGPIARGDRATVRLQRAAVADRSPADLALFDALVAATGALAERRSETEFDRPEQREPSRSEGSPREETTS